jgi:8-oxo-dGTP diphosphatase
MNASSFILHTSSFPVPPQDQGISQSKDRYHLIPRVLCFVTAGDEVLLLKGAPNKKIWANQYNGLGGHVERGETVYAAAAREIEEESGVPIANLRLRGVVTIDTGEAAGIGMFVFTAEALSRETRASHEGALAWVRPADFASLKLVEDLPTLLPFVLGLPPHAPPFSAQYRYDSNNRLIIQFH